MGAERHLGDQRGERDHGKCGGVRDRAGVFGEVRGGFDDRGEDELRIVPGDGAEVTTSVRLRALRLSCFYEDPLLGKR